jgi:hypothetical protein
MLLLTCFNRVWNCLTAGLCPIAQPAEHQETTAAATPIRPPADEIPPEANETDIHLEGEFFIGPNGQPFGNVRGPGLVNYGATTIDEFVKKNPGEFAGVPRSLLHVMQAVSVNEGKLEAINTWDNSFLSFGVYQWTAGAGSDVGELAGFLDRLKGASPALFQKYFGKYGLCVEMKPPIEGRPRKGYLVLNNQRLDTSDKKEVLRKPLWAYRFWRAAHDSGVRRVQVMLAMERVALFYRLFAGNVGRQAGLRFHQLGIWCCAPSRSARQSAGPRACYGGGIWGPSVRQA